MLRLEARIKNAKLMEARERLGLSIREISKRIGISECSLGGYENLRLYPEKAMQEKICDFYNIYF